MSTDDDGYGCVGCVVTPIMLVVIFYISHITGLHEVIDVIFYAIISMLVVIMKLFGLN